MNLHRRFLVVAGLAISPAIFAAEAAPKIGVLLKSHVQFWTAVEKGALEAGGRAKAEVVIKAPASEADIGVQVQNDSLEQGLIAQRNSANNFDMWGTYISRVKQ